MAKYTDEQIKKAVKHCLESKFEDFCEECPFYDDADACENQLSLLLDLINRQEAEIERLKKRVEGQKHALFEQQSYTVELQSEIANVKSEAIKEFAERLKELMKYEAVIYDRHIDNLVKEMVGEGE